MRESAQIIERGVSLRLWKHGSKREGGRREERLGAGGTEGLSRAQAQLGFDGRDGGAGLDDTVMRPWSGDGGI